MTFQNLLIRIWAAFFPFKIILVIRLLFSLFYLSYISSKIWGIFVKYWCIKQDRKDNHVFNPWFNESLMTLSISRLQSHYEETNTFYHSVPRSFRYSTERPRKDERLSWPSSHPVVLNWGPLDWESSILTISSLLLELRTFKKLRAFKKLNKCLIKRDFDSFLLWELQEIA